MQNKSKEARIKTVKLRLPKWVICLACGVRQIFRKHKHHYKYVKDLDLNRPRLLMGTVGWGWFSMRLPLDMK